MENGTSSIGIIRTFTRRFGARAATSARNFDGDFLPDALSRLHNPKNLQVFWAVGGVQGLVAGLKSHQEDGLGASAAAIDLPDGQAPPSRSRTEPASISASQDFPGASTVVSRRTSTAAADRC